MKQKFINHIINFITKNKECDEIQIKKIRYGLEGLYNTLNKTFVVIIATLIIGTFKEFLLLLLFYALIRKDSFGLHASSSLICWLTTLPIYIGGSLIVKYLIFEKWIIYLIWTLSFLSFVLWAPADTPKRPLIRKKDRTLHKITTCITSICYLIIIIFINNSRIINAVTFSLIIQGISINPVTYFVTKTRFNNYKYYVKSV